MSVISLLLRLLAIGWFLFCLAITLALTFTDHWLAFAIALTPLPSLLVPVSLVGTTVLLFVQRRSAAWMIAALVTGLILTPYAIGQWTVAYTGGSADDRELAELAIVSANAGKRDRRQLLEFAQRLRPDLIAVQAARLPEDSPLLAGWHYGKVERLSLWSRWPIISDEPIVESDRLVAARFEVDWPGERLAVYVMHLPSPREVFEPFPSGGFAEESSRLEAAEFHGRKWSALGSLSARIADESGPVLLVGDANQPALGPAYRELTHQLRDGHHVAGRGFGYTLQSIIQFKVWQPPLAWTRIDYILANRRLAFREHRTEAAHPGQHRAIFARVRLVE